MLSCSSYKSVLPSGRSSQLCTGTSLVRNKYVVIRIRRKDLLKGEHETRSDSKILCNINSSLNRIWSRAGKFRNLLKLYYFVKFVNKSALCWNSPEWENIPKIKIFNEKCECLSNEVPVKRSDIQVTTKNCTKVAPVLSVQQLQWTLHSFATFQPSANTIQQVINYNYQILFSTPRTWWYFQGRFYLPL